MSATYLVETTEEGKSIRAKISYRDGEGFDEVVIHHQQAFLLLMMELLMMELHNLKLHMNLQIMKSRIR